MSISLVYEIKGGSAVSIERRNGTKYQVHSPDYQSMVEYRAEYLAEQAKRKVR